MPFVVVQQHHVEVLDQQARKVWEQKGVEVQATLAAVNALLEAAFAPETPLSVAPLTRPGVPVLTQIQWAALTALVDEDLFWSNDVSWDEVEDRDTLFIGYGLPTSRDALRHLLAQRGASPAEPLTPTLTHLQYWVVAKLEAFEFLWEGEPDLRFRLEQLLMDYGLPASRVALRNLRLG